MGYGSDGKVVYFFITVMFCVRKIDFVNMALQNAVVLLTSALKMGYEYSPCLLFIVKTK